MSGMTRPAEARRAEILRRLTETGFVAAGELARDLRVSEMTIRRDLRTIAADGLGRRIRGGLGLPEGALTGSSDRKSTRLNSSHVKISYAVFCLKKKSCSSAN